MSDVSDGETIVVDTAVWMDALLFGASSEELVKLGVTGRVRLISSELLLGELADVLQRGLDYSDAAVREVLRFVRDTAHVIDDLDVPAAGISHNIVFSVARQAGATCVATTEGSRLPPTDIPVFTIA